VSFTLVRQNKDDAGDNKTSISAKLSSYNSHITNLNNGSSDYLMHLQRTVGNQAVQRLVGSKNINSARGFEFAKIGMLQPKLKISQPGDAYEQEADKVADQVMRMPDSSDSVVPIGATRHKRIDRKCTACEMKDDEEDKEDLNISRKPFDLSDLEANDQVANEISNIRSSGGSSLDSSTKEFMESRFGFDFSNVRIYTDGRAATSAQSVNALAYAAGNDIVFGHGQYQPNTLEGRRLLAHELTHVVQQTNATMSSCPVPRAPEEKPKRLDVVLLGEGVKGGEELSHLLTGSRLIFQVSSIDGALAELKNLRFPIGTLYFVTHSLANGSLKFGEKEGYTEAANIATKLKGAVSVDNAPLKVDFRGCSIGTSPKAMDQIRAALGARSVIGGTCYLVISYTTPIKIGPKGNLKEVTKASDVTDANRHLFEKYKKRTLDTFGAKTKCILNPTEKGFFDMGGRFVSLFFNRKLNKEWIAKESVCYKDIKHQIVDDPGKSLPESQDCQLIVVQEKSEGEK
jgi:hypothetical protein